MKFVIDSAIPFIKGIFENYAEVQYCEGESICTETVRDADALVIRSRTGCSRALLEESKVKIISSVTTGTVHIDRDWCESRGIYVTHSAGSNAGAVMNYVFSALYGAAARKGIKFNEANFGIIGNSDSGKRVAAMAGKLGFRILCNEPVENGKLCSLEQLLGEADIVSLHTGWNEGGECIADAVFFERMKPGAIFINTSDGRLVDENALLENRNKLGAVIIDTWQGEPDVNLDLLEAADIATPHIAGYSYMSKQLSTAMAVRSVARFFSIQELYDYFPKETVKGLESVKLDFRGMNQGQITSCIQYNYPVFTDDFMFRMTPREFRQLRKNYKYRKEFYTD